MMLPKKEKMSALLAHQLIEERIPFPFSFCTVYDFLLPSLRVFNSTTRCFLCTHTTHTHTQSLVSLCINTSSFSSSSLIPKPSPTVSHSRISHSVNKQTLPASLISFSLPSHIYIAYNKQHCYSPIY